MNGQLRQIEENKASDQTCMHYLDSVHTKDLPYKCPAPDCLRQFIKKSLLVKHGHISHGIAPQLQRKSLLLNSTAPKSLLLGTTASGRRVVSGEQASHQEADNAVSMSDQGQFTNPPEIVMTIRNSQFKMELNSIK